MLNMISHYRGIFGHRNFFIGPGSVIVALALHALILLIPVVSTITMKPSDDSQIMQVNLVRRASASSSVNRSLVKEAAPVVRPLKAAPVANTVAPVVEEVVAPSKAMTATTMTTSTSVESSNMGDIASSQPQQESQGFSLNVLKRVDPVYPKSAIQRGMQGTAVFRVKVLPSGNCGEVELVQSSGYSLLDSVAKQAVKQWRFSPKSSADTVALWVEIPVAFVLKKQV
jgi:protein TonB